LSSVHLCICRVALFALQGNSDDLTDVDPDDPFAAQDKAEHDKMVAMAKRYEAKYVSFY